MDQSPDDNDVRVDIIIRMLDEVASRVQEQVRIMISVDRIPFITIEDN